MADRDKDPLIGTRIREYEILELLGKGGMGAVYRARHVYLADDRAIKVVQTRHAGDKELVERFIREARLLTRLSHPNLVQLFEFGTLEDDTFFMVMEYLNGESLLQRIYNKGRIAPRQALKIIRDAAIGLMNAHAKGITHRDISPDNILLVKDDSGNEITKVIDFGIAKPGIDSTFQKTAVTVFLGKPEYCSPEQCGLLDAGETIDARSDIYSLGVTLYHALTGRLPFLASSPQGYILKHVSEIPRPPSYHVLDEIPAALDSLVMKMLEKRREDRYDSMEKVIQQIDDLNPSEAGFASGVPGKIRPITSFQPGTVFANRYLIESKLGEGGMGIVYRAMDNIIEAPVALKIMSGTAMVDPKTFERFKREVILARRVTHPNVCRLYDMGKTEGVHYVSMELLKGTNLAEMLQDHSPVVPDVGLSIIRQVLSAVKEAHKVGVIHRDLKPKNIIVDDDMKATITDFGISISADLKRITDEGSVIGTPYYMAPEQFQGKEVDQRADIYSIGIIMYEIFTGKLPFPMDSAVAVIFAHLKTPPVKPAQMQPDFPPELEAIILKAMEKEPENRYQTVQELAGDLDRFFPSSSVRILYQKEALAHKLIAEKSYSRAIKYLNSLLKRDSRNTEMQKLLNIAITEKTRKDVRRVRSLIKKKNLVQAQILMERIRRLPPQNERLIRHLQKLESMLGRKRRDSVNLYIREAEEHLKKGDLETGAAKLESAANLDHRDERISELVEAFLSAQQQKLREEEDRTTGRREARYFEMLSKGMQYFELKEWEKAVDKLQLLVESFPDHPDALPYLQSATEWAARASEVRATLREAEVQARKHIENRNWDEAIHLTESTLETNYDTFVPEEELEVLRKQFLLAKKERQKELVLEKVRQSTLRPPGPPPLPVLPEEDLVEVPPELEPQVKVRRRRSPLIFVIPSILILLLGLEVWKLRIEGVPLPPPMKMTIVNINVLPWARIRIVPLEPERAFPWLARTERITPLYLLLPEGTYSIKMQNDTVSNPISRKIKVKIGQDNIFTFKMPDYDTEKVLAEIGEIH